jgi:K+-sensing histidine kinase KdpD
MRSVWREPVGRPVERAEEGAGGDRRIARAKLAGVDAGGDERSHAALIAIALGDDRPPKRRLQRIHLEMGGRPLELVDQAAHVGEGKRPQPCRERAAGPARVLERLEQAVERAILAEKENLVLPLKVVIQVRGREVGGHGDIAHPGRRVATRPEYARGRPQDRDAARVGTDRTPVRISNHRSILLQGAAVCEKTMRGRRTGHPRAPRSYNRTMRWLNYAFAAAVVVVCVLALRLFPSMNSGTAAPLLLLVVVIVARMWGIGPALFAASAAAASISYYFLGSAGFWIENANDWVAFVTFIITAVIAGELSARAERRRQEAQAGRHEIERLYQELQIAFDRASEAEAARRNEQLKAALLDALTHNLRTPLTAIKAAVTALIAAGPWYAASPLPSEGRRELLEVIDEESDRLNRFIEGLSTPSRVDGSHPPHLRSAKLDDILRAGLVRAETVTRDHRVVVHMEDEVPPVSVDPSSIAEVVYILLDNASKYAPGATTIVIRAAVDGEHHVRIAVDDEGPGIEPAIRERVFEKFFRVPARVPHDPRRGGIGLGLPIARRLVEAQAGRIWIEAPESGVGTRVIMRLPIAVEASDEQTPAAAVVQ